MGRAYSNYLSLNEDSVPFSALPSILGLITIKSTNFGGAAKKARTFVRFFFFFFIYGNFSYTLTPDNTSPKI